MKFATSCRRSAFGFGAAVCAFAWCGPASAQFTMLPDRCSPDSEIVVFEVGSERVLAPESLAIELQFQSTDRTVVVKCVIQGVDSPQPRWGTSQSCPKEFRAATLEWRGNGQIRLGCTDPEPVEISDESKPE